VASVDPVGASHRRRFEGACRRHRDAVQAAAAIVVGYPLVLGDAVTLELGAAGTFAPVSCGTTSAGDGTASLIGLVANVGASYQVIPAFAVRLDAGAGVLLLGGLEKDGNPFTMSGTAATGTLSALLVRGALSADYAVTQNVLVTATPIAVSYSRRRRACCRRSRR
jgi:hypothetical protein